MSTLLRVSSLLFVLGFQAAPTEPGWTSLFNGKDLTGWKVVTPASWTVKDGAIVANGMAGHVYYDGEFKNHMFRNFELKVDVMAKANSNGGVYVLTEYQDTGFPKKGFEIQVNNTYNRDPVKTGSLYHVQDVTRSAAERRRVVHRTHHRQGQQHHRQGERQAGGGLDAARGLEWRQGGSGRAISGPGTIALQAHDPNSTVSYKNIRIKPLD